MVQKTGFGMTDPVPGLQVGNEDRLIAGILAGCGAVGQHLANRIAPQVVGLGEEIHRQRLEARDLGIGDFGMMAVEFEIGIGVARQIAADLLDFESE